MKVFLNIFSLCVLVLAVTEDVRAFKLDTHIWIGQQVLNDLADDGKLEIRINNKPVKLDVRSDIKDSILEYPSAYLLGNIGPDAAPDVVVGQTAVHPGVEDADGNNIGWQANDWMEYLLEASQNHTEGKAYTYGYLGHAAADVFAHTYVNQYAGDIFKLSDETLVEQRHFMLESYIGKYTPALINHLGQSLGDPWQHVVMSDSLATFIRDTLIYNEQVEEQYWKVPTATHLAAYSSFRDAVDSVAEDGIWDEIDTAIVYLVANYYGYDISMEEAGLIVDAANDLVDAVNEGVVDEVQQHSNDLYQKALTYEEQGFQQVSSAVDQLRSAEQSFIEKSNELIAEFNSLDSRMRQKSCSMGGEALERLVETLDDIHEFVDPHGVLDPLDIHEDILDRMMSNPLDWSSPPDPLGLFGDDDDENATVQVFTGTREQYILEQAEHLVRLASSLPGYSYAPDVYLTETKKTMESLYQDRLPPAGVEFSIYQTGSSGRMIYESTGFEALCSDINNLLDNVREEHMRRILELQELVEEEKSELIEAAHGVREQSLIALNAVKQITNSVLDFVQVMGRDVNPVQSMMRGWRDDIDLALVEYVKAANQSMVNTMNPAESAIDPIIEWFDCYHMSIIGINSNISGCQFTGSFTEIIESLETTFQLLDDAAVLGDMPNLSDLQRLKDELVEDMINDLKEEVAEEIVDLLPDEVREIMELLDQEPTDSALNYYFTKAETVFPPKGLIMIGDMSQRVKAEMGIVNGKFNPNEYAVIYNAVVLTKLALLDKYGYEQLGNL